MGRKTQVSTPENAPIRASPEPHRALELLNTSLLSDLFANMWFLPLTAFSQSPKTVNTIFKFINISPGPLNVEFETLKTLLNLARTK